MPLIRKPLPDLIEDVRGDFAARFPGADTRTRRSRLDAFARVIGYVHHVLLGWLQWVSLQVLPDTADIDWLIRHGNLWGIRRKPAEYATGTIVMSGTPGTFVPERTIWQRADGVQYVQDDATTIDGTGSAEVVVTAAEAGAKGNADTGAPLTAVSPRSGLSSTAGVSALGIGAGADEETDAELRARILARIQSPPHGGNAADYRLWALSVPGVTRVWTFPMENGAGTVVVRFMMDRQRDAGIPLAEDVVAVQTAIDAKRPVTAQVNVAAPEPLTLTFGIQAFPVLASVRAAIEAELRDLILREAEPGGTLLVSHIREAISIAAGEQDHVLLYPTDNQTVPSYQINVYGGVDWS